MYSRTSFNTGLTLRHEMLRPAQPHRVLVRSAVSAPSQPASCCFLNSARRPDRKPPAARVELPDSRTEPSPVVVAADALPSVPRRLPYRWLSYAGAFADRQDKRVGGHEGERPGPDARPSVNRDDPLPQAVALLNWGAIEAPSCIRTRSGRRPRLRRRKARVLPGASCARLRRKRSGGRTCPRTRTGGARPSKTTTPVRRTKGPGPRPQCPPRLEPPQRALVGHHAERRSHPATPRQAQRWAGRGTTDRTAAARSLKRQEQQPTSTTAAR